MDGVMYNKEKKKYTVISTYAKNLAPCGCNSNNLEANASPSINGGGAAAGARLVAALLDKK